MAAPSSQSPGQRQEEVLANGSEELPESRGEVTGGHPRRWERILVPPHGALGPQVLSELRLAGAELTTVRRAALCRLLQDEHRQQRRELQRLGKAFYVERL
ncbi:cilia- and flagella-associated protein 141 [Columba livia]|uniref:cilia- and flagella-associated protein 141 n=1 Tax=Columba livia TaxID=8932 RepID=UPI0031BABBF2